MEEVRPLDYYIRWDHTPDEILAKTYDVIDYSKKVLADILALQDDRTFENTIHPIAELEAQLAAANGEPVVEVELDDAAKEEEVEAIGGDAPAA